MKRTAAVVLSCAVASVAWTADLSTWSHRHQGTFPTDFTDVAWSPSGTAAVAVGSDGGAAWSDDSGATWTFVPLGTAADATGVCWQDGSHVWVTGELPSGWSASGVLLTSADGGASWTTVIGDQPAPLTSVAFADATHGYAGLPADGVLATTDGGQTWNEVTHAGLGLAGLAFVDALVGHAAGRGFDFNLSRTTDGGSSWAQVYTCPDGTITGLSIPDGVNGFLASPVSVAYSTDGGATWAPRAAVAETWIEDILFANASNGWLAGLRQAGNDRSGLLLVSNDGGLTWADSGLDEPDRLTTLSVNAAGDLFAGGSAGTLLRSNDGGASWLDLADAPACALRDIEMDSPTQGWAVGPVGTVHRTEDGGATWTSTGGHGAGSLESIVRATASTLYACGSYAFIASDDNGATWELRYSYLDCHTLWFFDTLNGLAGTRYGVYWTDDGGFSWSPANNGGMGLGGVFDLDFLDATNGFAAAGLGRILETVDAGHSWTIVHDEPAGFNSYLYGISFASSTIGAAVGMDGVVLTTADGGATWSHRTSDVTVDLNDVKLLDTLNGVAVGDDGTVLVTSDAGSSWVPAAAATSAELWAIDITDPQSPLIVGDWGTVLVPSVADPIFSDDFESGDLSKWSSSVP